MFIRPLCVATLMWVIPAFCVADTSELNEMLKGTVPLGAEAGFHLPNGNSAILVNRDDQKNVVNCGIITSEETAVHVERHLKWQQNEVQAERYGELPFYMRAASVVADFEAVVRNADTEPTLVVVLKELSGSDVSFVASVVQRMKSPAFPSE